MKKIIFLILISFAFIAHSFGQATGKVISDFPAGGTIDLATVSANTQLNINQTTAGQTITVASLVTGGKLIYIRNIGSVSFTLTTGGVVEPNHGVMLGWTGSAWNITGQCSDGVYLPLTGGTMTGNIEFSDASEGVTFTSGGYLKGDGSGGVTVNSSNGQLQMNSSGLLMNDYVNNNYMQWSSDGIHLEAYNVHHAYLDLKENTIFTDGQGNYLQLDGKAVLTTQYGNNLEMNSSGVYLNDDVNNNGLDMTAIGVEITDGANGSFFNLNN